MIIDKENRLGRLFFWALGICEAFTEKDLMVRYSRKTSNCHFFRVILFYVPLIFLSQLLFWTYLVLMLLIIPIYTFGFIGFLKATGLALGGLLIFTLIAIAVISWPDFKSWMTGQVRDKSIPTFWILLIQWLNDKKKGICGEVIFVGGDKNE